MALVESIDIPLGTPMPAFDLPDPDGQKHASTALFGPTGLLVAFTCNHCPYAKAIWPRLILLSQQARELGVETVAINPNIHPNYPEDAPEMMKKKIKEWGIGFPYLVDETQKVAQAFKAQCTPDLYLFDSAGKLVYHGRLDDNWQDEAKVERQELKEAVEHLAAGKPITAKQVPSMGCSIKWR
jgi:peroxiredoxin